jgi:hypothetical protein
LGTEIGNEKSLRINNVVSTNINKSKAKRGRDFLFRGDIIIPFTPYIR